MAYNLVFKNLVFQKRLKRQKSGNIGENFISLVSGAFITPSTKYLESVAVIFCTMIFSNTAYFPVQEDMVQSSRNNIRNNLPVWVLTLYGIFYTRKKLTGIGWHYFL